MRIKSRDYLSYLSEMSRRGVYFLFCVKTLSLGSGRCLCCKMSWYGAVCEKE